MIFQITRRNIQQHKKRTLSTSVSVFFALVFSENQTKRDFVTENFSEKNALTNKDSLIKKIKIKTN